MFFVCIYLTMADFCNILRSVALYPFVTCLSLFCTEDGGCKLFRHTGTDLPNYMASWRCRRKYEYWLQSKPSALGCDKVLPVEASCTAVGRMWQWRDGNGRGNAGTSRWQPASASHCLHGECHMTPSTLRPTDAGRGQRNSDAWNPLQRT
jgi:hypothetical protein